MANDKQVNGEVLGSDKYLDLAVVRIEKDGPQIAGKEIKTAIEHLLSIVDLTEEV